MVTQWGQIFTCVCSRVVPLERKKKKNIQYGLHTCPSSSQRDRGERETLFWNMKGLYSGMWANNASPGRRSLNLSRSNILFLTFKTWLPFSHLLFPSDLCSEILNYVEMWKYLWRTVSQQMPPGQRHECLKCRI